MKLTTIITIIFMPDVTDATPTEESVIPTDFTVF
jgi:hypothetical protein